MLVRSDVSLYTPKALTLLVQERAVRACDEKGVMRMATAVSPLGACRHFPHAERHKQDSIAALLLLEFLVTNKPVVEEQARIYNAAAVQLVRVHLSHVPHDHSDDRGSAAIGGRLFWVAYLLDAFGAVCENRTPHMTGDDVVMADNALGSIDLGVVAQRISTDEPSLLAKSAFKGLFGYMGQLSRSVAERITGRACFSLSTTFSFFARTNGVVPRRF
jgi:hypothetical protein